MILADIEELNNIDAAIIDLQSQLSELYAQRINIVQPKSMPRNSTSNTSAISTAKLSKIDLMISDHKPLQLR